MWNYNLWNMSRVMKYNSLSELQKIWNFFSLVLPSTKQFMPKKKIHVIVQKIKKKIIWLKGYGHLSVMISIVPMESCTEVWQNKVGIFKNTGFQSICYRWIIRFNNMDVIYGCVASSIELRFQRFCNMRESVIWMTL